MRFVVDAQLRRVSPGHLGGMGHDAVHVAELPAGESQPDPDVAAYADAEDRVVVTKDADFRHSHMVAGTPKRLLVVATGNIRNLDLIALIERRLDDIVTAFSGSTFVEPHRDVLVVHGTRDDPIA